MDYLLYGHGGSGNHGCEAIIRTTLAMLPVDAKVKVYSSDIEKDKQYGLTTLADFRIAKHKADSPLMYKICRFLFRYTRNAYFINKYALGDALKFRNGICLSVGGDNYCNGEPERHISRNKMFSKHNKTVLWGCSITPELMNNKKCVDDMKRYSLITARESITYEALVKAGINNVRLVPDPAFTLPFQEVELPDVFESGNVVGINISPLIMRFESNQGILARNIENLIQEILSDTSYNIALIPHVILSGNNDLAPMQMLYEKFKGSKRIALIDDHDSMNCCELKYVISKCRFMIAARTHASIAAYSSSVPTLVIGYSVKSKGIATDLFGTDDHYVIPIEEIKGDQDLSHSFQWLVDHEHEICNRYQTIMNDYIKDAQTASKLLAGIDC